VNRAAAVIVLAAGAGTRMKSETPKVLHPLAGRTLLGHAMTAAWDLEPELVTVVVRHEKEKVAAHARALDPEVLIAEQDEIPGTGRAVWCALQAISGAGRDLAGPLVVIAGDTPLLDGATLRELLDAHVHDQNAVTVLTAEVDDATGYGRIVRDEDGLVASIVEHRDATPAQLAITEINTSTYVFDAATLVEALGRVDQANDQGEMYLTDVVAIARADGKPVRALATDDPITVEGVNDRVQLAALRAELNRRLLEEAMRSGVTVVDPGTTWLDIDVLLEPDVTIHPGTQLLGTTTVASGATIGPNTTLIDTTVGSDATVVFAYAVDAAVPAGATIGPFQVLREGEGFESDQQESDGRSNMGQSIEQQASG
jgi:bifunctional UDP-N-acetylglucosamine pyrophosphorylase/glucosamine-1-phosphate N-acetyltransferase